MKNNFSSLFFFITIIIITFIFVSIGFNNSIIFRNAEESSNLLINSKEDNTSNCNFCGKNIYDTSFPYGKPIVVGNETFYLMDEEFNINTSEKNSDNILLTLDEFPENFSWKDLNGSDFTTPAKHQGPCGSCGVFAAIGALESAINIGRNNPDFDVDLSEQYVLSCFLQASNCNGSSDLNTLERIKETTERGNYCNGIIPESCLPYQASDSIPCSDKCPDWYKQLFPIIDYGYVSCSNLPENIEIIKTYLLEYGPVSTSMSFPSEIANYWASYNNRNETDYFPYVEENGSGHVVLIVGWYDDQNISNGGYWICKNSWSSNWGYDGFFNVEYQSLGIGRGFVWITAGPGIIYVDYCAEPNGNGTVDYPYQTIQEGIDNALSGDTVYVSDGTYNENIIINKSISLIGESNEFTIIRGDGLDSAIKIIADCVNISEFTIQNQDTHYGVLLDSNFCNIKDNIVKCCLEGIFIEGQSTGNTITKNHIHTNSEVGIFIWDQSNENTISWNNIDNNLEGILLADSSNNRIFHNEINNNIYGLDFDGATNNLVYHNNLKDNSGWNARETSGINQWDNGYISGGNYWDDYDEYFEGAYDLNNDGFVDDPYLILGGDNHDRYPYIYEYKGLVINQNTNRYYNSIQGAIDDENTLDGHTIFIRDYTYFENIVIDKSIHLIGIDKNLSIINGDNNPNVIEIYADNVEISGFTIKNGDYSGLYIVANNTIIHNNIIKNNYRGIYSRDGADIIINHNLIKNNSEQGINIFRSTDGVIFDNNIFYNGDEIYDTGITLYHCSSFNIYYNQIWSNKNGINLFYSENNEISANNIINNIRYGISILHLSTNNIIRSNNIESNLICGIFNDGCFPYPSHNNLFYHNNLNNTCNANSTCGGGNNWYNSFISEGNYWSDYTGEDTNDDGIGETPYTFQGGHDNYPFISPYIRPFLTRDQTPSIGTTGEDLTFKIDVISVYELTNVIVHWKFSNDHHFTNNYMSNDELTYCYTISVPDDCNNFIIYYFEAIDIFNNSGFSPDSFQLIIQIHDNDPPQTRYHVQYNINHGVLSFTSNDNLEGVSHTMYQLGTKAEDNPNLDSVWEVGPWMQYSIPISLEMGEYLVRFYSVDYAGNIEPVQSVVFRVIPPVRVISPNGGEIYRRGDVYLIKWESQIKDGQSVISFSQDLGKTWLDISKQPNNLGINKYKWYIPKEFQKSKNCLIKIEIYSGKDYICDSSDKIFYLL